jgi:hypothetical protein
MAFARLLILGLTCLALSTTFFPQRKSRYLPEVDLDNLRGDKVSLRPPSATTTPGRYRTCKESIRQFWPCKICTAAYGCYRRPVIVVALRAPAFGQLPCPSYRCIHSRPHSLHYVPFIRRSFSAAVFSPPAASFCPPPACGRQPVQ